MCSQEPPERPIALANSVLYVFPTTSDGLPLQASDKLCCVNMALPRDCEVWLTDGIRAVTVGKHLIQKIYLSKETAWKIQKQQQGSSAKEGWNYLFLREKSDFVSTMCIAGGS